MIARRVTFEGRVQGVGFRYTCKEIARSYEVVGTVQNTAEGTVVMELMGDTAEVEGMIQEIAKESVMAKNIKGMHITNISPLDGVTGFRIIR